MNIGEVLGKPFKYIWKNSILWALGMVTQIVPTIINFLIYYFVIVNYRIIQSVLQDAQLYTVRPDLLNRLFGNLTPEQMIAPILTIIGVVTLANLISIVISEFVRCCIIRGIRLADTTQERIHFKEVLQEGWKPFGKLILQDIFWGVVTVILWIGLGFAFGGIGAGISSGTNGEVGIIVLLCCLCSLAAPIGFFLSLLFPQIRVSLVHDDLGVFSSIGKGWSTVIKAFGWMLLLGLILGFGSYFIRWLSGVLSSIPINLFTTVGFTNENPTLQTTQMIMLAIFSIAGFFINSFIFTYITSTWTMAYRNVNYPPAPPSIPEIPSQPISRDSNIPPAIPS